MKNQSQENILFVYRYHRLDEILAHPGDPSLPKEFLYGYDQLRQDFGETVQAVNVQRGSYHTMLRKLCYLIEKPFSLQVRLGMPIEIFFENKILLRRQDIVICVNDPISFGVLFAKMLGLFRGRVVALMMSLAERLKYFQHNPVLIGFIKHLLKQADLVLTLSDQAQLPLRQKFSVPPEKLRTFHFGVDVDFWKPASEVRRRDFLLSVGNDFNRDYSTLVRAVPAHTKLVIVTEKPVDTRGHKKIKVISGISDVELRHLYRSCRLAVIPSRKLTYESSGLSSTLQAMACGAPVLVSDAPPMREYFQEKKHIFFYPPEQSRDLQKKILALFPDKEKLNAVGKQAHQRILEKFTTRSMANTWPKILKI